LGVPFLRARLTATTRARQSLGRWRGAAGVATRFVMESETLALPDGRRIAYSRVRGRAPGVVFLGGFRSDMAGTKAGFLDAWARARGQAFLRFDYTGHGASSGEFRAGAIGDWARDAHDAILALAEGPQVLVGSSMGGWLALLLSRRVPGRVAGLVGIAAAPDFTEDGMWAEMDADARARLATEGEVLVPSEYGEDPYPITLRLIEDGRANLVLRDPLDLPFPVRLLHGSEDRDVPLAVALRLLAHARADDMQLTIVKGADHRFSAPENLELIARTLEEIL
jgi:pimeloyl-ACP methyl ester carboxylesterase